MFSAENLVCMRKERKLNQKGVTRCSGLATVTISKLEEGKISDPSRLMKKANLRRCDLGYARTPNDNR